MGLLLIVEVMNEITVDAIPAGVRIMASSDLGSAGSIALVHIIRLDDNVSMLVGLIVMIDPTATRLLVGSHPATPS